jgi:hypothetical protein
MSFKAQNQDDEEYIYQYSHILYKITIRVNYSPLNSYNVFRSTENLTLRNVHEII